MLSFKIIAAILLLLLTLFAGGYPYFKRWKATQALEFPIGEAFACGIFLGVALLHMLAHASEITHQRGVNYPLPFLLVGATFLFLLLLEHFGREFYAHQGERSPHFAILACVMLSVHSFLAGLALGISHHYAIFFVILIALIAHKWAASFSLAVQLTKSSLSLRASIIYFLLFSLMLPLGILVGSYSTLNWLHTSLFEPVLMSLAAGTFLYLGTLHGLRQSVLLKHCCDLKHFSFVIFGFALMAVVAIWI